MLKKMATLFASVLITFGLSVSISAAPAQAAAKLHGLWAGPTSPPVSKWIGGQMEFQARAWSVPAGHVQRVQFTYNWGGWHVACTGNPGFTYECPWDMRAAGVPENTQVPISFDVYGDDGPPNFAPNGLHKAYWTMFT
jgi:hypothetical protein